MSKRKDNKVLFEALSNRGAPKVTQEAMKVPEWMKSQQAELEEFEAQRAEEIEQGAATAEPTEPQLTVEEDVVSPAVARGRSHRTDGYFSRVDEIPTPTVEVSLMQLMVAAGIVLVLLGVAFWMGMEFASPDETPAAGNPTPPVHATTPTQPITTPGQPTRPPVRSADPNAPLLAVEGHRDPDRFYLVIQLLNGADEASKTEAEKIKAYLATKGVSASINTVTNNVTGKKHYLVWDLLGYPSTRIKEAQDRIVWIERLGEDYFRRDRSYKFIGPFYHLGRWGTSR